MALDGVPYAIGGGAVLTVEALRLAAYIAAGGGEGVVAGPDLAVTPTPSPSAGVQVADGGGVALNLTAAADGAQQAYGIRNASASTVAVAATGGASRSDLVAVIVEDPTYAGQPAPASVEDGPYVRFVVYQGVSSTAKTLADVDPGQTGIALARIDLPASTAAVQTAHIVDLRKLASPRTLRVARGRNLGAGAAGTLTSASFVAFPTGATWTIDVPSWATQVVLEGQVVGARVGNDGDAAGEWQGQARVRLGGVAGVAFDVTPAPPAANRLEAAGWVVADTIAVPAADRGTQKTLALEALRTSTTSGVAVTETRGTTGVVAATFVEGPYVP